MTATRTATMTACTMGERTMATWTCMKSPRSIDECSIDEVLRLVRADNPFEPLTASEEYMEGWKAGVLWARPDVVEAMEDEIRCIHSIRIDGPSSPCTLHNKRCPYLLHEQPDCADYQSRCIHSSMSNGPYIPCFLTGEICSHLLYEQPKCANYEPRGGE